MKKRIIALILLLSLIFSFAACGVTQGQNEDSNKEGGEIESGYQTITEYTAEDSNKEGGEIESGYQTIAEYTAKEINDPGWNEDLFNVAKYANGIVGTSENPNFKGFKIQKEDMGWITARRLYYNDTDLFPGYAAFVVAFGDFFYVVIRNETRYTVLDKEKVKYTQKIVRLSMDTRKWEVLDERTDTVNQDNWQYEYPRIDMINSQCPIIVNKEVIVYTAHGGIYMMLQKTGEKRVLVPADYNYEILPWVYALSNTDFVFAKRTPEYYEWMKENIGHEYNDSMCCDYYYVTSIGPPDNVPAKVEYFVYSALTDKIYSIGVISDNRVLNIAYMGDKIPEMLKGYYSERDTDLAAMKK